MFGCFWGRRTISILVREMTASVNLPEYLVVQLLRFENISGYLVQILKVVHGLKQGPLQNETQRGHDTGEIFCFPSRHHERT
jgi:hypothetical protein